MAGNLAERQRNEQQSRGAVILDSPGAAAAAAPLDGGITAVSCSMVGREREEERPMRSAFCPSRTTPVESRRPSDGREKNKTREGTKRDGEHKPAPLEGESSHPLSLRPSRSVPSCVFSTATA
jgi:hypothetical protein